MKTKLIKIAYSHDEDTDEFVVFKNDGNLDHAIFCCKTAEQADQWIFDNFITLRKGVDYNLCLPFEV